jgi:hypothetical protein
MPLFKLTIGASNSIPMAVSDGEKRHEDRRQTQNQIIDWLDNYLSAYELQDKMKRKSDEINEEESENSSQSKKLKGMKTSLKKPVLLRKCK